ncbi:Uncharacterised protein [Mycobacteroides abscessus subsp. abscessus]|nr:Uncharacterised protein [Mycobacteroides abscessus subsp. abscessus]
MSPRIFAALVGAVLVVVGIGLSAYEPSVSAGGRTIKCGTLRHPDTPGAWEATQTSRHRDGTPTDYRATCDAKRETVQFAVYGLAGVGILILIGAGFVRTRKPVSAE